MPVNYLLPPADVRRWTAQTKAAVVQAVERGAISVEDACSRWGLSEGELAVWRVLWARCATRGLRATHRVRINAIVAGLLAFGACPAHASDMWALEIYVLPCVANADQSDTIGFYACASAQDCVNKTWFQVPPVGVTVGSVWNAGNDAWEILSVPTGTWNVWAGWDAPEQGVRPSLSCSSNQGQWAIITRQAAHYPAPLTDADKHAIENLAVIADGASTAFGFCAATVPNPTIREVCGGIAATATTAGVLGHKAAADPADFNYTSIASPTPLPLPDTSNSGPGARCETQIANVFATLAGHAEAISTNADRYSGAQISGDSYWAGQQQSAIAADAGSLVRVYDQMVQGMPRVLDCFPEQPVANASMPDAVSASALQALLGPKAARAYYWGQMIANLPQ